MTAQQKKSDRPKSLKIDKLTPEEALGGAMRVKPPKKKGKKSQRRPRKC